MPVLSGRSAWSVGTAVDTAAVSAQCADGVFALSLPRHAPSRGSPAADFPPAGGIGVRGFPLQAHLSYKCYACAIAAEGGGGLAPRARGFLFKRPCDFKFFIFLLFAGQHLTICMLGFLIQVSNCLHLRAHRSITKGASLRTLLCSKRVGGCIMMHPLTVPPAPDGFSLWQALHRRP